MKRFLSPLTLISATLLLIWWVGILCRGYWTPDEPREADIAWRMSWQADKAIPLLAGEPFCEKPPLTYWVAAIPIRFFGAEAWSARLPNLLYAAITALGVGLLGLRSAGRFAGLVAAAAISTFLLAYQVTIWLATDAPLLASVSVALLGAFQGFYATRTRERLRGYLLMHAALGLGFLCKSAAAWMVPAMTIVVLALWEKRWRELLRWELYLGLVIQAVIILSWVWFVYSGANGIAHLKVFFWNNLIGRFTQIDAPSELQYTTAHRNFPGKYLIELPLYLAPWTLLVLAAARRAWLQRKIRFDDYRPVRFALAACVPSLVILSAAATARNIYLAPALPGVAMLLAWWAKEISSAPDPWDLRALRATSVLLLLGVAIFIVVLSAIGAEGWNTMNSHTNFLVVSTLGLAVATLCALRAWAATTSTQVRHAQWLLLLAYGALLTGPTSQVYARVDTWQNLASIAHEIEHDSSAKPLILFAPDETTRAMIDMYARTTASLIPGPIDTAAIERLKSTMQSAPQSLTVAQLPRRAISIAQRFAYYFKSPPNPAAQSQAMESLPDWALAAHLKIAKSYSLPNGRRYALLEFSPLPTQ